MFIYLHSGRILFKSELLPPFFSITAVLSSFTFARESRDMLHSKQTVQIKSVFCFCMELVLFELHHLSFVASNLLLCNGLG